MPCPRKGNRPCRWTQRRGLLLTLIALSGEFPAALVSRLPGGDAYKMKVVKQLKRDRFLRTYYADGLRGFRLTATRKKMLLESWPDQFVPYLTGCSETNTLKSELTRRLRLYRMAEVLVTMYNAGVAVFPWQKPDVFGPTPPADDTWIKWPVYRHFYYLTSDHRSEVVLWLLCDPNKRAMLDNILREGLPEPQPNWFVENDALDEDEPVLFEYTCDMPRIRRFCDGLRAHKRTGILSALIFRRRP